MKYIINFLLLLGLSFSINPISSNIQQRDECEDFSQDECYQIEWCEWNYETGECSRIENDFNDDDWSCSDLEDENDCIDMGCTWLESDNMIGGGSCTEPEDEDDWDDEENYCEGLSEEDCSDTEGCQWYEAEGCYRFDDEDDWSCSDLEDENDCIDMGCTWLESNNMIGGGSCTESQDEFDCNPDLACATVLTCYEGLLYPTSCGPENCDEPIGECDDNNEEGCFEEGEWYDYGQEIFISDCEYLECTPNGWSGPFTLDNEDCSDNNDDWECSDLGYEECMEYDLCDWVMNDNPVGNGYCVNVDNEDGPPECVMDCDGIENINPEEDTTYFCNWLLDVFPSGCAEDCDQEILDEIEEWMIACDECLADNNCDEDNDVQCEELNYPDCIQTDSCEWTIINAWGGYGCIDSNIENNCYDLGLEECIENMNCEPNFNAAGGFESCEESNNWQGFGYLYGRVEYIYGDVIDFVPYAMLHIESIPSNADIFTFEVMADGEGYYFIELPAGAYVVTAYANEESLSQDVLIDIDGEFELNFLLGDWDDPWNPIAELKLLDANSIAGGSVSIPLNLSSSESVGGLQFSLNLLGASSTQMLFPEGIESYDDCFTAESNYVDGQLLAIIFSLEGCSFSPQDNLHVADLVFSVSDNAQSGQLFPLEFSSTIVSDSIGNEIPSYGIGCTVTVGSQGDINGDNEMNVLDVVMMVNFALMIDQPNESEFWASDLNDDNAINVLDIVQLVNMILDN